MKHKTIWFVSSLFVLGMASLVRADDPTSRFFPLSRLASSLPSSSTGNAVQFEVWDSTTGGTIIFAEQHTVDTDAGSNITNDTGLADLLLGRGTTGGLAPVNFPAGSTRYLDVTQGGTTVLTARVPLYASAFTVSPPSDVPGNLTLADSSGTAGNILKGGVVFLHNFGTNNAFLGSNAGNLSMTGVSNTGSGASALQNNTSGNYNTANGTGALFSNTNGEGNTASGYHALYTNCSSATPCSATQGSYNTAVGSSALAFNTTGFSNTASGAIALSSNTTGFDNTASGVGALSSNTTGPGNTATGVGALFNNTTGYTNTASGANALFHNTIGANNTASGGDVLFNNTTGSDNTASGINALYHNTIGANNTAFGFLALLNNTTGSDNIAIGHLADVSVGDLTNATAVGAGAVVDASNKIRLGNDQVTVVEGPPYSTVSDKNKKENFKAIDADDVLRKVRGLSVTSWNYIGHDPQLRHYGPVAQDFFGAFGDDGAGTIGSPTTITSTDMDGILILAVQALEKRTSELTTLKAENADLKARLEKLERCIATLAVKAE